MSSERHYLSTNQLAERLMAQPGTVRRSLCVNGNYLGIRPVKLPNGRLLWPCDEVDRLISEAAKGQLGSLHA